MSPASIDSIDAGQMPGGTMILCRTSVVSRTVPRISPASTAWPAQTCGSKSQSAVAVNRSDRDTAGDVVASQGNHAVERTLDAVEDAADQAGASSTESGAPSDTTISPGPRPAVSS